MHGLFKAGRVIGLGVMTTVGAARAQECGSWTTPFGEPVGFTGSVSTVCAWDPDGDGPEQARLVAAGTFTAANGIAAENIAVWDGRHWGPIGAGVSGPSAKVYSVGTWDPDGSDPGGRELVAVGRFATSGPDAALNNVARWDGTGWRAMGTGLVGTSTAYVQCMTEWDPDGSGPLPNQLVVGGKFTNAGVELTNGIAAWDGTMWRAVGHGLDTIVTALTTWDADGAGPEPAKLVAGSGPGHTGTGLLVTGVTLWNGEVWSSCGSGLSGSSLAVGALRSWDPDGAGSATPLLIAGGLFTAAGGTPVNNIAAWNGTAWSALGSGLQGGALPEVWALELWNTGSGPDRLVAGGNFRTAGGQATAGMAWWDGTAWTSMGEWSGQGKGIAVLDEDGVGGEAARLYAGGGFSALDGERVGVAVWDDGIWQPVSSGLSSSVYSAAEWDPDGSGPAGKQLIVGGYFSQAAGKVVNQIARWDGMEWWPIGEGFDGSVDAILTLDGSGSADELIVGGYFDTDGGPLRSLARWDGSAWQPLGSGLAGVTPPSVNDLVRWDTDGPGGAEPMVVVGGFFKTAGGQASENIAVWDGSHWHPLGAGLSGGPVNALTVWDPDGSGPQGEQIVAVGSFQTSGSASARYAARWDGIQWVEITPRLTSSAWSATTWDPDGDGPAASLVVVGGKFTQAGSLTVNRIAAWNGTSWLALGTGMTGAPSGFETGVFALSTWSAVVGGVEQLVAGGTFYTAGGVPAKCVALWNGSSWRALGSGVTSFDSVNAFTSYSPPGAGIGYRDLVVGGQFSVAGGKPAGSVAAWSERDCCPVDLTGDGVVDFGDYLEFLNLFEALDPRVDFNHDGVIDFGDYLEFLNLFDAGC